MNPALWRHGTSDRNVWENVNDRDEYRLPDRFDSTDLILDIGCNIGSASYACLTRGAGKVIAFEPDPDNYAICRKQLKDEIKSGKAEVYQLGVVGGPGFVWRKFSGVVQKDGEVNHGGAFLLTPDGGDYGLGQYIVNQPFLVPCIGVREVPLPQPFNRRLAKLDCEGSEWEILPGMVEDGWQQIVGEYHPYGLNKRETIHQILEPFYTVETVPHEGSELGLFFATLK